MAARIFAFMKHSYCNKIVLLTIKSIIAMSIPVISLYILITMKKLEVQII